jgi:hypothetical protein
MDLITILKNQLETVSGGIYKKISLQTDLIKFDNFCYKDKK